MTKLLLGTRALAPGHGLAWSALGTGVRSRALPAHRQVAPMTLPTVAANLRQTFDVHRYFTSKITFDLVFLVYEVTDAGYLALRQVLCSRVWIDPRFSQDLPTPRNPNAVDVDQSDLDPLVSWDVHSRNSCHCRPPVSIPTLAMQPAVSARCTSVLQRHYKPSLSAEFLALPLLVTRVAADNAHNAMAPDDLAFLTTSLDGWFYLHRENLLHTMNPTLVLARRSARGGSLSPQFPRR